MTIGDMVRGLFGKRHEDAMPSTESTSAQPETAKALTEQDLEQVQGGASVYSAPIDGFSKEMPESFQVMPQWSAMK